MTAAHRDTIFALSSGRGRAGVAVIRLSGKDAGAVVDALAAPRPAARRVSLRTIVRPGSGEPLDRGLVLWLPGPESFTGEDMAEFHVHGGPAVISGVLGAIGEVGGTRPAEAGEFTRRAFENGRLDLTEVEGIADMIDAETEAQRRQALRQMEGALGTLYDRWRADLIAMMAELEAVIDFPDEGDVPADLAAGIGRRAADLADEMRAHMDDGRRGERLRDGIQVVIAGRPNVGKSSLLNQLARRDAAIVAERAGTTRDVIEVHLDLGGYPVILVDTAGLREETGDEVEREGMARTRARLGTADLVVWVTSAPDVEEGRDGTLSDAPIDSDTVWVVNKSDLTEDLPALRKSCPGMANAIPVSALTGEGLDGLIAELARRARALAGEGEHVVMTRARHRAALGECLEHLDRVVTGTISEPELVAEDLRRAAHALGRIVGRVDVEDLLDAIFREFCIGK